MKYYKVIFGGFVIDVLDGLNYVKQSARNLGITGTGDAQEAMGILSSDSSEIWHLDGLRDFLSGSYQTVNVEEIEEAEYLQLREKLDAYQKVEDDSEPEPDDEADERTHEAKPDLVSTVKGLCASVQELEACILEMSEVVYA